MVLHGKYIARGRLLSLQSLGTTTPDSGRVQALVPAPHTCLGQLYGDPIWHFDMLGHGWLAGWRENPDADEENLALVAGEGVSTAAAVNYIDRCAYRRNTRPEQS